MVPAGCVIVCPACRVFVDVTGTPLEAGYVMQCPWCMGRQTLAQFAMAAARELCPDCHHPTAAHVGWWTPDGSPPHPATRAYSRATAAPCVVCAHLGRPDCTAQDGSREVAA